MACARVIIKLSDEYIGEFIEPNTEDSYYQDGFEKFFSQEQAQVWKELIKDSDLTINRLFTALEGSQMRDLVSRAVELNPEYKAPNFLSYFVIDCPEDIDAKALVKELGSKDSTWFTVIEHVYLGGHISSPNPVDPSNDYEFYRQKYLKPLHGIDIEAAWNRLGGDGAGDLRFVDIEKGWSLKPVASDLRLHHEDLPATVTVLPGNDTNGNPLCGVPDQDNSHGTSVMGIITGLDNTLGIVGIVPNLATAWLVSFVRANTNKRFGEITCVADAIWSALPRLRAGDVILLEAQTFYDANLAKGWNDMPVEVEDVELELIRLVTASGIIVVEAAGNGKNNLDTFQYTNSKGVLRTFDTSNPAQDSGAILVGAISSRSRKKWVGRGAEKGMGTNFGARIDTHAWGNSIRTTTNINGWRYGDFGGTSGASAIIAGVVLAIQGMAKAKGMTFSPVQMRNILRDTTINTHPESASELKQVGTMPNLEAIIKKCLST